VVILIFYASLLGIGFGFSGSPVEDEEGGACSLGVHAGIDIRFDAPLSHLGYELVDQVFLRHR
jgi:hypothetical protein